jgi:hypothetical protein
MVSHTSIRPRNGAARMAPMLAAAAALAVASIPCVSAGAWTVDGGGIHRTSFAAVAVDVGGSGAHTTWTWKSNVEGTVSEVEDYLIQSPLITSWGAILVVADNCTLFLLPDPATSKGSSNWLPVIKSYTPGVDKGYAKEFAGVALDDNDVAYILDKRDKAIHAVHLTKFGFSEQWWSPLIFNSSDIDFDLDVSLLPVSIAATLVVPLRGTLEGNEGTAALVSTVDGSFSFIPVPDNDCRYPDDYGSVAIDGGSFALLGNDECGLVVVAPGGSMTYKSYPNSHFLFDYGQHSHPVYDPTTSNLYFLDWAFNMHDNQFLCCINTQAGAFADCNNWPGMCLKLPELYREADPTGDWLYRWEWLALGLWPSQGLMYVSASASDTLDETNIGSPSDQVSAIFVFDVTNGKFVGQHRFNGDQFNSAPLVVTGLNGAGSTNVYVASNGGNIYCYSAPSVTAGYQWVSQDVAPIPVDQLPSSTYSYLTVTAQGTLLLTATAGGADWSDEKAVYGIINGVYKPAAPAPSSSGLSAGAAAGVAIGVIGAMAAFGFVGYTHSPFVKSAVDSGMTAASQLASRASSALSTPGSGRGAESRSLLASATSAVPSGGSGGSAAMAPAYSGSWSAGAGGGGGGSGSSSFQTSTEL